MMKRGLKHSQINEPSGINVAPVRRGQITPAKLAVVYAALALAYTAMEDVVSFLDTACIVCNRLIVKSLNLIYALTFFHCVTAITHTFYMGNFRYTMEKS